MGKKNHLSLLYLGLVFFLSGCGQMGPLYLPDQKAPIYVPHHLTKPTS